MKQAVRKRRDVSREDFYKTVIQCMSIINCRTYSSLHTDRGTPSLGIGSTLTVRILPSDDAFGVFSFGSDSLARVVAETEGGTAVTLTVQRAGGTFDSVSVYWEVQGGEGNGDITPVVGQIDFIEGQTEEQLVLTVSNDMVSYQLLRMFSMCVLVIYVCMYEYIYQHTCM